MHGISHANDLLASRDIRRYPNEVGRIPNRGDASSPDAGGGVTFAKVADEIADADQTVAMRAEPAVKINKPISLWEKENIGFGDFIDIINPLHHIPIVATLYRKFSDDQIGAVPRVIGGALWGRIGGFVSGLVNAVVEWWSGKDIGDHVYAAIFGPSSKDSSGSAVAQHKAMPAALDAPEVVAHEAAASRGADSPAAATAEPPPAAAPEIEAAEPAGRGASMAPLFTPTAHAALISYGKNLDWDESEDSSRVRFPA